MRIWSLHPRYLDKTELIGSWNDGLRALKLLAQNHTNTIFRPELSRFRTQSEPLVAIERYLLNIAKEASRRGYSLDIKKLPPLPVFPTFKIAVSSKQVEYEWHQLMHLLAGRSPRFMRRIENSPTHDTNPIFKSLPGKELETWEKLD